jgi:hypothetical protein
MDHRPNKKPRTDDDGMPASAVAAPPSAESLESPVKVLQLAENWGDGMLWKDMDHMTRLRSLTPRVIQTGRPPSREMGFIGYLPKAVIDPPSAKMETEMVNSCKNAVTAVKALFKVEEEADEEEGDEDADSDGYVSSTEGDGFRTSTYKWNNLLTLEAVVDFVEKLPRHLTFTAGFVALEDEDLKRCYCPCSPRSHEWLTRAGTDAFNGVAAMNFTCKGHYTPPGLLNHLRSKRDPLHIGILTYVNGLYPPKK